MDPTAALSAEVVVNEYSETDLARVISRFGEERFARRIAKAIVRKRPLRDTVELAETVKEAVPAATRRTGGHPARRTFQAVRIEVNGELTALDKALQMTLDALEYHGRAVVLSYHSLEDRMVKTTFNEAARGCVCPPDFPVCQCGAEARVRVLTRKPVRPGPQELEANPRSSAAKLRAIEKLEESTEETA
jgi:16S rRNA (cytosine1402-N4)-methyltransferase